MLRAHGQDLDAQQDARAKAHNGWSSFIVQLPLVNSSRMATVRNLLRGSSADLWIIPFDDRPGKLFEGLQNCRSAVFVSVAGEDAGSHDLHSSKYQRWVTQTRGALFPNIELVKVEGALVSSRAVSEVCQTRRGSPVCTGHTATYAQLCGSVCNCMCPNILSFTRKLHGTGSKPVSACHITRRTIALVRPIMGDICMSRVARMPNHSVLC